MSPAEKELAQLEEIAALEKEMAAKARPKLEQAKDAVGKTGKTVAGTAKEMLVSGLAGIPQQIGASLKELPPVNPLMAMLGVIGGRGKASADRFEAENSSLRQTNPYLHAATQGAVGGLVLSPNNAVRGVAGLAGAAGGLGAEGGTQAARGTGLEPYAGVLGSLLTGGLAGFALGPKQSIAQRDIRLETDNLTPADWARIKENARTLIASKADTATAAEAFPGTSGIKRLAVKAADSEGGEVLRNQLAKRTEDLATMGNVIPGLVDPRKVSLSEATRAAAEAASQRLRQIKSATQRPLTDLGRRERSGSLPIIPEPIAKQLVQDFEKLTEAPRLPRSDVLGRQDVLPAFLDPNAPVWERFVVDPKTKELVQRPQEGPQQALSSLLLNIAENTPSASSASQKAGLTIPKTGQNKARQAAFDTVYLMPEPWGPVAAEASAKYLARKNAWLTPAEEGPLRKIAGQKSPEGVQLAEARLSAVLDDPLKAGGTEKTLRDLAKGGADTKQIARALVERQLVDKPEDFAVTLAGTPGSIKERQLRELLRGADVNADPIMTRIDAANLMDLRPGMTLREMPTMLSRQVLLRPFRTLDMMLTKGSMADIQREVAQLLKDPRNIEELQKIARFDPRVRGALVLNSVVVPGLQQGLAESQ